MCRGLAAQLADIAAEATEVRRSTQPLLPRSLLREWLSLFSSGVGLGEDRLTVHGPADEGAEAKPEEGAEAIEPSSLARCARVTSTAASPDCSSLHYSAFFPQLLSPLDPLAALTATAALSTALPTASSPPRSSTATCSGGPSGSRPPSRRLHFPSRSPAASTRRCCARRARNRAAQSRGGWCSSC